MGNVDTKKGNENGEPGSMKQCVKELHNYWGRANHFSKKGTEETHKNAPKGNELRSWESLFGPLSGRLFDGGGHNFQGGCGFSLTVIRDVGRHRFATKSFRGKRRRK